MDNFPKILEILSINNGSHHSPYISIDKIKKAGITVCHKRWDRLLLDFPGYMPYRAQRACFGAAYIYVVLKDIYGFENGEEISNIDQLRNNMNMDNNVNINSINENEIYKNKEEGGHTLQNLNLNQYKLSDKNVFRAIESLDKHELSWALGAAVYMSLEPDVIQPFH